MVNYQILIDAQARPDLFQWFGTPSNRELGEWLARRPFGLPGDLVDFLATTGGGDFFESETVLGPLAGHATGDDAASANEWHRRKGLPSRLWLFHVGVSLSAVDGHGVYVALNRSYEEGGKFSSFEQWYRDEIRSSFATRYGLG